MCFDPWKLFPAPDYSQSISRGQLRSVPALGALIATETQTFGIPFRPSADTVNCTGDRWYDPVLGACYSGYAFNITFDFSAANVFLPQEVVYSVVYDTQTYGPNPLALVGRTIR